MGISDLALCDVNGSSCLYNVEALLWLTYLYIMKIKYVVFLFVFLIILMLSGDIVAQCPMCRMSAESNLKNGGKAGRGLNAGILYMFATPYLLVGGLAFVWWRYNRRRKDEEFEDEGGFVGIN